MIKKLFYAGQRRIILESVSLKNYTVVLFCFTLHYSFCLHPILSDVRNLRNSIKAANES